MGGKLCDWHCNQKSNIHLKWKLNSQSGFDVNEANKNKKQFYKNENIFWAKPQWLIGLQIYIGILYKYKLCVQIIELLIFGHALSIIRFVCMFDLFLLRFIFIYNWFWNRNKGSVRHVTEIVKKIFVIVFFLEQSNNATITQFHKKSLLDSGRLAILFAID